jgi:hypothetical protein
VQSLQQRLLCMYVRVSPCVAATCFIHASYLTLSVGRLAVVIEKQVNDAGAFDSANQNVQPQYNTCSAAFYAVLLLPVFLVCSGNCGTHGLAFLLIGLLLLLLKLPQAALQHTAAMCWIMP